jgi:hybrid cluster-associated redox disulfide protein
MKITKSMTFEELFQNFSEKKEEIALELMRVGLGCVGCMQASFETLEEGFLNHGFEDKEIDEIIEKLNSIVNKS